MKIDNSSKSVGGSATRSVAAKPAPAAGPAGAPAPQVPVDSVAINASAARLAATEAALSNIPTVNAAKVEAIKQAITEGRFEINTGAIADGLVATVKDLLANR